MIKPRYKPDPDDFVIIIMGVTGSGKTNFVNKLTGNAEQREASRLKSDTQNVTPYPIPYQGIRLTIVDTPGFDDTYRSDLETLRVIANWLIQKYPDGTTLRVAGIIYLHRITDNRMSGSAYKNLQMFGRLCGDIPLPRTRLVTTMWDRVKDGALAELRESQLKNEFWRMLIDGGAAAHRFHNTLDSAQAIIDGLLDLGNDGELLLQKELVEQQKLLNETEAGKVLYNSLQKLLADQMKMLKELAEEAKLQNDSIRARGLQEECNKTHIRLQKTLGEIKEMKIPLFRRIFLWLHAVRLTRNPASIRS